MHAVRLSAVPAQRSRPRACLTLRMLLGALALLIVQPPIVHAEPGVGQPAPEVTGERWVNSEPLSMRALRGRVVLVEFWTYG
jgi:hypothetical protein